MRPKRRIYAGLLSKNSESPENIDILECAEWAMQRCTTAVSLVSAARDSFVGL